MSKSSHFPSNNNIPIMVKVPTKYLEHTPDFCELPAANKSYIYWEKIRSRMLACIQSGLYLDI